MPYSSIFYIFSFRFGVKIKEMNKHSFVLQSFPNPRLLEEYLLANSNLPGPRSNLELAAAAADELANTVYSPWLLLTPEVAPENTPQAYLVFIAVLGLGREIGSGNYAKFTDLRKFASDRRWRVRESVAMALQHVGRHHWDELIHELTGWIGNNPLEMRAVVAGLCEPDLLQTPEHARQVLEILEKITQAFLDIKERTIESVRVLRQGLGYCWSVAIVAYPEIGKPRFETLASNPDPDIQWIVRENLKKNRLIKMDEIWVDTIKQPGAI